MVQLEWVILDRFLTNAHPSNNLSHFSLDLSMHIVHSYHLHLGYTIITRNITVNLHPNTYPFFVINKSSMATVTTMMYFLTLKLFFRLIPPTQRFSEGKLENYQMDP